MRSWLYLLAAGLLEIVWLVAMKRAEGVRHLDWFALFIGASALSFVFLLLALRDVPAGTAYAVWTGIGAAGGVVAGILLFGESTSAMRLACVGLILAGVIGLKLAH